MEEGFVSTRECEKVHEAQNQRFDRMDENFKTIFEKLDEIVGMKGKVELADSKAEAIGKKFDSHANTHGKFITWSLAILALASTLIAVITSLLKHL